ncbi:MAG: N-acetylmuramic acid 6-phosphate etherase [Bacillota bacterium]
MNTERPNPVAADLDLMNTLDLVRLMNSQDAGVAGAVARVLPQVAQAVDLIVARLSAGGRLIYVGAGTSGRLAVLDAAECPPTFGVPGTLVQAIMAGGEAAVSHAVESREDDREAGAWAIRERAVGPGDVVVGITASGNTPFTRAALDASRLTGACTILVSCSPVEERAADLVVVVEVGPEVISGSTRLKAGTAQKMILNMLSTAAMVRLGRVYSNLMLEVKPTNAKLSRRLRSLVALAAGVSESEAEAGLRRARDDGKLAVLLLKTGLDPAVAAQLLEQCSRNLREALRKAGTGIDG